MRAGSAGEQEPGHVQLHKDQEKPKGPQHFTNGIRIVWK